MQNENQFKESQWIKQSDCDNRSSNKFVNDGSFMDKFKKTDFTPQDKLNTAAENESSTGVVDSAMSNSNSAVLSSSVPAATSSVQQDWFQDALKRAREKARELGAVSATQSSSTVFLSEPGVSPGSKRKSDSAAGPSLGYAHVSTPSDHRNFRVPSSVLGIVEEGQHMEAIKGIMITKLSRDNPAIIAYALKVFGSRDLSDAQWKQCEEQMKMNIVFQLLQEKKKEAALLESRGKVKYEYDSDEETEGGTWEHKRRKQEMGETSRKADELTRNAEGRHHIGDFLPPAELAKFMEKYEALKTGRDPDLSDYRDKQLTEDNIGFRMLKTMGWTEGAGLGAHGKGITTPVNQKASTDKGGLGADAANDISADDDEYDSYRKRMMLAYRFRPNPMNNPRRAYY